MTPARWEKIKSLYHQALQLNSDERAAFLKSCCGHDEDLRVEVESLLRHGEQSHDRTIDNAVGAAAARLLANRTSSSSRSGEPIGHSKSRGVAWWMYVLVGSFGGFHALILYLLMWGPAENDGMQAAFENDAMRIHAVEANSHYDHAGLRAGDLVLAVDGVPARSSRGWTAVEANMAAGQPQRWTILRGDERLELRIAPERGTLKNRVTHGFAGYLITAWSGLILGLLITFQRPADPVARVGAWFIMTASIAFGLGPGWAVPWRQLPFAVQLLLWIPQISRFVVEGIFLSLFVIFPRRLFHSRWAWAVLWTPVLATLPWRILGLNSLIHPTTSAAAVPPWLNLAISVRTMVYLAAGIVVLLLNYRRLADLNERRRVRVLVAGTAVALVGAIFLVWFFNFIGKGLGVANTLNNLGFAVTIACPLAFYYAIIRHRVFDIHVIIRQGLQYALARGAVLGIVPLLAAALVLDLALNSQQPLIEIMRARGWIYAVLGGLVLLIYSQRKQWLDALDRRFFRERYDANRVLRDVVKEIREAKTFEQVSPRVVARIETALHSEMVSVLMRRPQDVEFYPLASAPAGKTPPVIRADSKLIGLARVLGRPLEILLGDSAWLERQLPHAEIQFVRESRIDLLVPIALEPQRTEALLLLGIKRSEEPYTREDQELLEAIASSLALLLEQPTPARELEGAATFEECPDCGTCYERNSHTCTEEGAALVPIALPRTLSGRYRLERRRGRGGMGTVYEATDIALERRVAVKVIRHDLVHTTEAAQRFRRESRAAAAFSHPNVVTVHDYGVESGTRAFLVMELLTGATLRDEMTLRKRLSPDRSFEILRSVCAAVEAAHGKRLIHRDLKPENIFLARTPDGKGETVKVLDFGVAKFLSAPDDAPTHLTAETAAGMVVGTPAYMSPEQLLGEEPAVLWDLWALAVVAYEMLAGALPFALTTSDWRRDVIAGTFTPVQEHLMDAPVAVQAFFEECFTPDQAKRPASVADFRAKLEAACLASAVQVRDSRREAGKPTISVKAVTTIAVLPLENLSRDPDQEYFADGMTDELITTLTRVRSLKVISRTSVMRYKNRRRPLSEIARQLGADAVVEGTVLRAGDRVRINAQLVHASSDTYLWAASYERELPDVLGLHNEVSQAIAQEVQVTLSADERQRLGVFPHVDPRAYEAYLRGRHHLNARTTEGFKKAIEFFEGAIGCDPEFALPHAGLAEAYAVWYHSPLTIDERFGKARDAALRALALDDFLAEAHASRAYLMHRFEWDWAGAEKEFERALDLNPGYSTARQWYALFLVSMGRYEEAVAQGRLAIGLDPLSSSALAVLGRVFYFAGRLRESIEQIEKALDLNPHFSSGHMDLARAYALEGKAAEAIQHARVVLSESGPNPSLLAELAYVYARVGRRAEAGVLLADIRKRLSTEHTAPAPMAYLFVALGDFEESLGWLEKEYSERGNFLVFINTDPWLAPLRSHPRFQRLLASLRFPAAKATQA